MKKVIIAGVFAMASLTLFSFRGVDNKVVEAEITDVTDFSVAAKNFTETYKVHSDNFSAWRKSWTDYDRIAEMNVSVDEMTETLEKF